MRGIRPSIMSALPAVSNESAAAPVWNRELYIELSCRPCPCIYGVYDWKAF